MCLSGSTLLHAHDHRTPHADSPSRGRRQGSAVMPSSSKLVYIFRLLPGLNCYFNHQVAQPTGNEPFRRVFLTGPCVLPESYDGRALLTQVSTMYTVSGILSARWRSEQCIRSGTSGTTRDCKRFGEKSRLAAGLNPCKLTLPASLNKVNISRNTVAMRKSKRKHVSGENFASRLSADCLEEVCMRCTLDELLLLRQTCKWFRDVIDSSHKIWVARLRQDYGLNLEVEWGHQH